MACALPLSAQTPAAINTRATLPSEPAELIGLLQTQTADRAAVEAAIVVKGAKSVAPLLDLMASPRNDRRALALLSRIGAKSVPVLLDSLEDPVRQAAAGRALSQAVATQAAPWADRLVSCLKSEQNKHVCGMALVQSMNPRTASRVPLLAQALRSSDRDARLYSALALRQIGAGKPAVAAALRTVVEDPDAEVRDVARKAVHWKPIPVKKAPAKAPAAAKKGGNR